MPRNSPKQCLRYGTLAWVMTGSAMHIVAWYQQDTKETALTVDKK